MNADRYLVGERIAHLMNVADARRHRFHLAGHQTDGGPLWQQSAPGVTHEALSVLGTAQHADQPPDPVVVDRCLLPRAPDEAHHRETLARVAVQQVLLIALRVGLGEVVRQPVVMGDQLGQQALACVEQGGFVRLLVKQRGEVVDEVAQALRAQGVGHGSGSALRFQLTLANLFSILKMQNKHKLICKICIYRLDRLF
ncbi:hypothetical protein METHP14_10190 [Pseudomonas sp. P14-2025]